MLLSKSADVFHKYGHAPIDKQRDILLILLFLKFLSDNFKTQQDKIRKQQSPDFVETALQTPAFYNNDGVMFIPDECVWDKLLDVAPEDLDFALNSCMTKISQVNPQSNRLFDNSFRIFNKDAIYPMGLRELILCVNELNFYGVKGRKTAEQIYEYVIKKYTMYEGKYSGCEYTPQSITQLLISLLQPINGTIYDPCFGFGNTFIQNKKYAEANNEKTNILCYGQEINLHLYELAQMNLMVHNVGCDLGIGSVFTNDVFQNMTMDYVVAIPPFNMTGWYDSDIMKNDKRWIEYGMPPKSNGNYAWILHALSKMNQTNGVAAIVLPNNTLSDNSTFEIRKKLVENDKVEAIISLPAKMFWFTDIPVTIWILNNNKSGGTQKGQKLRNRTGEILFVDLSAWIQNVYEKKYVQLLPDQTAEVCKIYFDWQSGHSGKYSKPELFYAAKLDEIRNNDYNLMPTRYIEFAEKTKILSEPRTSLGDITCIEKVSKIDDRLDDKCKVLKKFKYPLNYEDSDYKTSHKIKKGDILIKSRTISGNLELVYISDAPKSDVYAPADTFVLTVNDKRFNSEFLYLYLNSETFKKYATKYFVGTIALRLQMKDLQQFPIIIPKSDLKYYEGLFKYQQNPLIYNKEYIDILKQKPLNSDIETEFRLEEIKQLADKYNSAAKENYMNDIKEVEACFNAGAYKATLILCGSILEGFLLDWLNELQPEKDWLNQDFYIDTKNNDAKKQYNLNDYINQIEKIKRPHWMKESAKAHEIRKQRNLVHAKLCLKEDVVINKRLCVEVIKYLKDIIDTREGQNE